MYLVRRRKREKKIEENGELFGLEIVGQMINAAQLVAQSTKSISVNILTATTKNSDCLVYLM